jgi:hypothetical protein
VRGFLEDRVGDAPDDGVHALLDGDPTLRGEGVKAMADTVELLVRQLLGVAAHGGRVRAHASTTFSRSGSGRGAGLGCGRRPTTVKPANMSAIPTSWPRYTNE